MRIWGPERAGGQDLDANQEQSGNRAIWALLSDPETVDEEAVASLASEFGSGEAASRFIAPGADAFNPRRVRLNGVNGAIDLCKEHYGCE